MTGRFERWCREPVEASLDRVDSLGDLSRGNLWPEDNRGAQKAEIKVVEKTAVSGDRCANRVIPLEGTCSHEKENPFI